MSHPLCIDNFKQNDSFYLMKKFLTKVFLTLCVYLQSSVFKEVNDILLCYLVKLLWGIVEVVLNCDYAHKSVLKALQVPVILNVLVSDIHIYRILNELLYHAENVVMEILSVKHLLSLLIDYLTLCVHNVVVVKDVLSDVEVSALYLLL